MGLALRQDLQQQQEAISGGASRGLLIEAHKRVRKRAIQEVLFDHYEIETELPVKPDEKWYRESYRSLLDALLVETFPEFRVSCEAFYENAGPPLREILTQEEAQTYDAVLVGLIEMGYLRRLLGEPGGWEKVQASFYRFITPRPSFPGKD